MISLNTTLSTSLSLRSFFSFKYSLTCQAIASPSRSGSVAKIILEESFAENGELITGKVGKELSTEKGYEAAKRCGLSIIAQAKMACGGNLSKIKSCIKLTGFVNSTGEFTEQPKVINGASDLIKSIFGDAGFHTRAAVSASSLPLGVSVEVDAIFELN